MTRHAKSHDGIKLQCALCPKSFARKDNLAEHVKIVHCDGRVATPTISPQAGPSTGPSTSTVPWTTDEENDELFMEIDMDKGKISFIMAHHIAREKLL
ncbi:Zinc finger C2H2-type [Cinara cedri]|uniref:Zinc finger C2H2-type n=1 Tax=Cinara cedri TaxID=506608 RepID=A0A5E4M7C2_9HEMI|nr:Zinc finger C2H2-type [Cinara cedri]